MCAFTNLFLLKISKEKGPVPLVRVRVRVSVTLSSVGRGRSLLLLQRCKFISIGPRTINASSCHATQHRHRIGSSQWHHQKGRDLATVAFTVGPKAGKDVRERPVISCPRSAHSSGVSG